MTKTPSLGMRVQPETMAALEKAAKADMRSVSSLVEKILIEWLQHNNYLRKHSGPELIAAEDLNSSNDE